MKIVILTSKYLPSINGNTTTVSRLVSGLSDKKILTNVIDLSKIKNSNKILKIIKNFNPDLIHAFHAYKSGPVALDIAKKLGKPLLVTITGTDVNHDLINNKRKKDVKIVLNYAKKIVVFHESIKVKLIKNSTLSKTKINIIKQSVKLERKKYNLKKKLRFKNKDFVFLLPAGIRKVKYQNFCVDGFKRIHVKYPNTKIVISGPIIEKDFAISFFKKIKDLDWIYYLEKIPHDKMYFAMKSVDVVLNKSVSEGGMSNAVLEAMYIGKPILASNIEGNRSIIKDNFNGLLFNSEDDFFEKAEKLIKNKKLREMLGKNAKLYFKNNFSFNEETESYVKVYGEVEK